MDNSGPLIHFQIWVNHIFRRYYLVAILKHPGNEAYIGYTPLIVVDYIPDILEKLPNNFIPASHLISINLHVPPLPASMDHFRRIIRFLDNLYFDRCCSLRL